MARYLAVAITAVLMATACSSTSESDAPPATSSAPKTTEAPTTTVAAATTTPVSPTTTVAQTTTTSEVMTMEITSPSFDHGADIPTEFSCDGENISPELGIENLPDGTVTLVLIMDDPDAPGGTWVHWVAFDFPPTNVIEKGNYLLGIGGNNSWDTTGYGGPCPPSGTHRYFFKLFALEGTLELPQGSTKEEVLAAMEGLVLDQTELMGRYTR